LGATKRHPNVSSLLSAQRQLAKKLFISCTMGAGASAQGTLPNERKGNKCHLRPPYLLTRLLLLSSIIQVGARQGSCVAQQAGGCFMILSAIIAPMLLGSTFCVLALSVRGTGERSFQA
jgi:hypothetical protein